jgi:hypothetical protein
MSLTPLRKIIGPKHTMEPPKGYLRESIWYVVTNSFDHQSPRCKDF